jgi:A/G-specific adenine glycosylase
VDSISKLPGIGRYTANAVATFGFDQSVPIVEANIARVLSRLFNLQTPIDTSAGREQLWSHATHLVPMRRAGEYNAALMELGALVCGSRPKCGVCPVKRFCRTTDPSNLPQKKPRRSLQLRTENHGFVMRRGRVLLEQATNRWRGMWILPPLVKPPRGAQSLHRADFPFTHHRVTLNVYRCGTETRTARRRWFSRDDLASIPVPSPHRRALTDILASRVPS